MTTATATAYPITIPMSRKALEELSNAEHGSYEDEELKREEAFTFDPERDRALETHTHIVAQRFKSKLVIKNRAEAEDVYYAVCSGTFGISHPRIANRIADVLRPFAKPSTVAVWPCFTPWGS